MESKFEKFLRMILDESIFKPVSSDEKLKRQQFSPRTWINHVIDGDIPAMQQILDARSIINDRSTGQCALEAAIANADVNTVEFLLKQPDLDVNCGADIDANENSSLVIAIYFLTSETKDDMEKIFKMLLDHPDIDPNIQSILDKTPLEVAILDIAEENINPKMIEMLISHPKIRLNQRVTNTGYQILDVIKYRYRIASEKLKNKFDKIIDIFKKHGISE